MDPPDSVLKTLVIKQEQTAAFLHPMVESCFPEEILKVWQRSFTSCYDVEEKWKPVVAHFKLFIKVLWFEVETLKAGILKIRLSDPLRERWKQWWEKRGSMIPSRVLQLLHGYLQDMVCTIDCCLKMLCHKEDDKHCPPSLSRLYPGLTRVASSAIRPNELI